MTQAPSQPMIQPMIQMIRMPMRRLACVELLAWLLSGGVVLGIVSATGHASGAWMGAGATLVGLVGGLLLVGMTPEHKAISWAVIQIGASTIRMIATLGVGIGIHSSLEPDKTGFWGVLLLTSVAVLAAEILVFLPVLRSAPTGARTDGAVTEASV